MKRTSLALGGSLVMLALMLSGCASFQGTAPAVEFDADLQREMIEQRQLLAKANATPEASPPPTLEARLRRGDSLRRDGNYAEAMWVYLRAHKQDPDAPEAPARIGSLQLMIDGQRAETIFRQLVETHPENGAAHAGLGMALIASQAWGEARVSLERAVELEPRSAAAHSALGVSLERLGFAAEARVAYLRATTLQPEYYEALNNLGVSYLIAEEFAPAEKVLRRAASLQDRDPAVFNNLGLALGRMERYDEALNAFQRAGSEQAARNNLGYVSFLNGHHERAIAEYERALLADGDQRLAVLRNLSAARRADQVSDAGAAER